MYSGHVQQHQELVFVTQSSCFHDFVFVEDFSKSGYLFRIQEYLSIDSAVAIPFEDGDTVRPRSHKSTTFLPKGCENPVIESNSTDRPLRFRRLIQHHRSAKLKIGCDLIIQGRLTPDTTVTTSNSSYLIKAWQDNTETRRRKSIF